MALVALRYLGTRLVLVISDRKESGHKFSWEFAGLTPSHGLVPHAPEIWRKTEFSLDDLFGSGIWCGVLCQA